MLSASNDKICERAKALYQSNPQVKLQIYQALRADRVVRIQFVGPGEDDFTTATVPRERFAERYPFMRPRPLSEVAGEFRGFLQVCDATGGAWISVRSGVFAGVA